MYIPKQAHWQLVNPRNLKFCQVVNLALIEYVIPHPSYYDHGSEFLNSSEKCSVI